MNRDRWESGFNIITQRTIWQNNQMVYYTMRMDGLPRLNKPFPRAADGVIRVIDNAIRKRKPYLMGQITAGNKLCNFRALKQQVAAMSDAAADYYDFVTCNYTKFFDEMDCVFDTASLRGRAVLKCTIDPINEYALVDEAIDPLFLLMPQAANDFEDADEWIHVRAFTVASYMRLDDRWDKTPETIAKIRGQPVANLQTIFLQKQLTEGITNTVQENQLIVWEHWVKTQSGHTIYHYSPHAPEINLRTPHGNPYKWQGKPIIPFVSIPAELKDKGWYSPRGLGRLLAPEQEYQTKLQNEKADAITFYNTPVLTSDKEIGNSVNYRWTPGQVVAPGAGLKPIITHAPPISFDEEMYRAKERSAEIAQEQDFAINTEPGGKPRTATRDKLAAASQQAGNNYLGEIIHRRLRQIHTLRWALMVQYKERDFIYYAGDDLKVLPEQALHDSYLITPDGTSEGWNRAARFSKAIEAMQTFLPLPNSNPEYWVKEAMSAYDARAVAKGGFVPTNLQGQEQYQAQAEEILLLVNDPPFPVQPMPSQDQMPRIKCLLDYMKAVSMLGYPVKPQAMMSLQQNLAQRIQILHDQNPDAAKQVEQELKMLEATRPPSHNGNGRMELQPNQPPAQLPQ